MYFKLGIEGTYEITYPNISVLSDVRVPDNHGEK